MDKSTSASVIESCINLSDDQLSTFSELIKNNENNSNFNLINNLSLILKKLLVEEQQQQSSKIEKHVQELKSFTTENESLFFKVWKHIIINQEIFKHVKLYNNYTKKAINLEEQDIENNLNGFENLKYGHYINSLILSISIDKSIDPDSLFNLLQKLPNTVDTLKLNIYKKDQDDEDDEDDGDEEDDDEDDEDDEDEVVEEEEPNELYTNNNLIIKPIVPQSITSLIMPSDFNIPLGLGSIPSTLKELSFEGFSSYNQPLSIKTETQDNNGNSMVISEPILPKNGLTTLKFGFAFSQTISKSELPESLTKLELGYKFNSIIEIGALPNSISHLSLGTYYPGPIVPGLLPNSLTYLETPIGYGQLVQGVLPIGLKVLKFYQHCLFDDVIEPGLFPMGIETIEFGNFFNQSLENLPSSIKSLSVGDQFNQWSTILGLTSLETLEITSSGQDEINALPPHWYCIDKEDKNNTCFSKHLKSIRFSPNFQFQSSQCIPPTVEEIIDCELEHVKYLQDTNVVKLIIKLKYDYQVEIKAKDIPLPKLKELTIGYLGEAIQVGVLNHLVNLESFSYDEYYCHEILPFTFPDSLTSLKIGSFMDEDEKTFPKNALPPNLIYLSMKTYNLPLSESYFPPSIKVMEFSEDYESISGVDLPPNIETLIIQNTKTTLELPLPNSLKSIYICPFNSILNDSELYDKLSSLIKVVDYPIFKKLKQNNKTY